MSIEIRPASPEDRGAINRLLRRSLQAGDDPRYDAFLEWKHRENPFGASYEWVAMIGDELVGYRSFLRWEFLVEGEVRTAVRAVDTATEPAHQGKGIFRALTTHGLEQLATDGVAWVFNTPNDSSRPGYLKMGWVIVGKVPVALMLRSPLALRHLRSGRQPAARWSEPCDAFEPAVAAIERHALDAPDRRDPTGWTTNRTPAFLRWRYGLADLDYRGMTDDDGAVTVFRVRRRGPLVEAMIGDVLLPPDSKGPPSIGRAARAILRATRADVAVIAGRVRPRTAVPIGGPQLTWRTVSDERIPTLAQLSLCGGDVELF